MKKDRQENSLREIIYSTLNSTRDKLEYFCGKFSPKTLAHVDWGL